MNWFNIRLHVLLVLLISWHSLTEAEDSDEERIPRQQKVDSAETDTKEKARSNTAPNIVDQIFSQPALRPTLAYNPGQSINYNIGYNLGRTIGKTPFLGASLDRKADASKVVLVLANDTPETSDLPQPDSDTLKRLVRTPGFWDQFASQMATFNQQLSAQVPEMSRTVGAGINEFISQTPILGDAQQTGALDFANLGKTFGESLPNLFPKPDAGDASSGNGQVDGTQPPPSETERVENDLTSNLGNPLLSNPLPLMQGLQSFVPPGFPTPQSLGNMFPAVPAWPWLGQNQEGAASDISEVRVRPGTENPYKISPKEGVTQKMTEMKLRAAMKDALDKKTIPILWFSLPLNTEKQSNEGTTIPFKTPTSMSDDDLIMRKKLEAFEKQLISELKTLQEVVKLANAMKKAQLEAKGKKFDVADVISPLALTNTPIYKITLADIEKTLKDEYVRKLLQMIYNSQHKDMKANEGNPESTNTKYSTDLTGNPNKRQAATASEAMAHLNKDDMMNMMAYAFRIAAANGQEVPWQTDLQQQSAQRQWIDSQSNMEKEQQRKLDSQQTTSQQAEQRQWLEPNAPMNQQQFQDTMQQQAKQRQWLESNAQMNQQPFQQTMPQNAEQRQWLESNAQMKQQPFQQTMPQQAEQRQWVDANTQMQQQSAQQTEERQWIEAKAKAQMQHQQFQQTMQHPAEQRQSMESNAQMNQPSPQQTMPQQVERRQWLEPNGQMKQTPQPQGQMPTQMRQMGSTNTQAQMPHQPINDANDPNMQRRQWLDTTGQQPLKSVPMTENKDDMAMQQQRQMLPSQMDQPAKPNAQFVPNMNIGQPAGPAQTNERQMTLNPQFQMSDQQQQLSMGKSSRQQQSQMATPDSQAAVQQNVHQMSKQEERQTMAKHDPEMPVSNEATPQMPENAGKERHKGLDDFMDDLDLFGHNKGKNKKNNKGTTINYYYNAGGSRYPPIYGQSGGYGGGYGAYAPPPPPPSYGYGGGHARPNYGGYARPQQGYYGGGGYGSNAYGSRGGYRTATGDDEIEEMLRQHKTLPTMMLLMQTQDDNRQSPIANPNTGSSRTTTSFNIPSPSSPSADNKADLRSLAKSNQPSLAPAPASDTAELLPSPTSASPLAISEVASPPSASLSASEDFEYSDSPEMRSMFSFSPKLLKPFMGLQKVGRKDDPWLHKPYNLYQPIFTGGGTFESLLNRYRRHVSTNPTSPHQSKHVLTPGMLDRLLRIKVNFEKNYPFLYKTMMGHLLGDKHTTLSITPPEIPDQVSYPNVELAAAEIHQLEMLVDKLKKGNLHHQHKLSQQHQPSSTDPSNFNQEMLETLINSYNDEKNFWDEITDSVAEPNSYWHQFEDSGEATPSGHKSESFWSELEAAEEREKQRQQWHSRLQSADGLDKLFTIDEDFD